MIVGNTDRRWLWKIWKQRPANTRMKKKIVIPISPRSNVVIAIIIIVTGLSWIMNERPSSHPCTVWWSACMRKIQVERDKWRFSDKYDEQIEFTFRFSTIKWFVLSQVAAFFFSSSHSLTSIRFFRTVTFLNYKLQIRMHGLFPGMRRDWEKKGKRTNVEEKKFES